mgnify:CR=1 FL=1
MSSGWIKLSYKLLEWEWYGDTNMVRLFLHLLLKANYKPVRREGVTFGRGVVVTSREELHRETGISPRSIRTCIERLKSTNEITIKTSSKGSVITLTNYDKYQSPIFETDQQTDQQTDQRATSKRPTSDQQTTSSIEYNNINNIYYVVGDITREAFFDDFFSDSRRAILEQLCMARQFGSIENFKRLAADVLVEWESVHETHRTVKDARQHLINHCSKKMSAEIAEQKKTTQNHETAPAPRQHSDSEETRRREFIEHIAAKLSTPDSPEPDLSGYY